MIHFVIEWPLTATITLTFDRLRNLFFSFFFEEVVHIVGTIKDDRTKTKKFQTDKFSNQQKAVGGEFEFSSDDKAVLANFLL